jgi:hypothetical protein
MSRVFRKSYTRPIPDGAEHTTVKDRQGNDVPAVRFKGDDGKWIVAPLTAAGDRCRMHSPTWYGKVRGEAVPLCPNKAASEQMLAALIVSAAKGDFGLVDRYAEHRKRPLVEHLDDFRIVLEGKGDDPRHVRQTIAHVKAMLDGCRFRTTDDLDQIRFTAWLTSLQEGDGAAAGLPEDKAEFTAKDIADLLGIKRDSVAPLVRRRHLSSNGRDGKARRFPRETAEALLSGRGQGAGPETVNHYIRAVRSFLRWMADPDVKRLREDHPLAKLPLLNSKADVRRARRELTADELGRLLAATRSSTSAFRGLDGEARFALYATACGTGFRAGGLASLTPECFDLNGDRPIATLPVRSDKSRKGKRQHLQADVAELLRGFLDGKPAGMPLWPGTWASDRRAAEMLRRDLEAAGIPFVVQSPDGPLHADFHALRHNAECRLMPTRLAG